MFFSALFPDTIAIASEIGIEHITHNRSLLTWQLGLWCTQKKQTLRIGDILCQSNVLTSHLIDSKWKMYSNYVKCDILHYCKYSPVITLLSAVCGTCRSAVSKNPFSLTQVPFSHLDKCLLGTCASDKVGTFSSNIPAWSSCQLLEQCDTSLSTGFNKTLFECGVKLYVILAFWAVNGLSIVCWVYV